MEFGTNFLGRLNGLLALERSELLWLNTHEFLPAKPVSGANCKPLSASDIQRLSLIKDFDISEQLAHDFDTLGFVGIGMFIEKKLVGLTLFATDDVPARYTKQSDKSNGLELALPAGTRCQIKAIVLQKYRGQRLHSAMVRYAIDHFGKDTVHTIVAAYDTSNKAFLASSLDQGFEKAGKATEVCLLGKSLYRLPKPVDSLSGEISKDKDDADIIVFRKAA